MYDVSDNDSDSPQRIRRRPAASNSHMRDDSDSHVDSSDDSADATVTPREVVSSNADESVAWALNKVKDVCEAIQRKCNSSVNLGTLCSGLDVAAIGARLMEKMWPSSVSGPPMLFKHVFACEIDEAKLKLSNADVLWRDIVKVGSGTAVNERTHVSSPTLGCDVLVAGFVCKDFSLLNNSPTTWKSKHGKSGGTFFGVKNYVKRHTPLIVILENVKAITSVRELHGSGMSPAHRILNAFRDMGYDGGFEIINTQDFGLPQRRNRCYFIFVYTGEPVASRTATHDPIAATAFSIVARLMCSSMPLTDFLSGDAPKPKRQRRQTDVWKEKHAEFMADAGIDEDEVLSMMSSDEFTRQPLHQRTKRQLHLTAIRYVMMKKKGMNPFTTPMVLMIDQACKRIPSSVGACPCVTPGGQYWISNAGVLLTEYDKLAAQGVTHAIQAEMGLDKQDHRLVGDMAGNAFSLSVINAVILGALGSWATR